MILNNNYNPDVLTCLANLSNDEVFTPPQVVNRMLDMLPQELFCSKETKFLDPVSKSGVFLREIAKRLMKGLEREIPDIYDRADHILTHQLYGIAITELTALTSRRSLYCSKHANGPYSICRKFQNEEGNLRFRAIEHKFVDGKCKYCGASESVFGKKRRKDLESHAYEFIHTDNPRKLFGNMKFDVIIGNPPYQMDDGGNGASAKPIYHHFVEQAIKLLPRYLTMIIPSRWFVGGKGLDSFRLSMQNDKRITKIVDFDNSSSVFPGVDIAGGVNYFLWQRDLESKCTFVNVTEKEEVSLNRYLNEYPVIIRQNKALPIIEKVLSKRDNEGRMLSSRATSRKPFGLPTNYHPQESGVPCWFIQKIGLKFARVEDVSDSYDILNKWKLLLPKSPIAGQTDFSKPVGFYYDGNTRIAKPGECCTESWFVLGAFNSKKEVLSLKSYIFTKIARFLLLQAVVSQDVTKQNFMFVPDLENYNTLYSDEYLREHWNITDDEWDYIDSRIHNYDGLTKLTDDEIKCIDTSKS